MIYNFLFPTTKCSDSTASFFLLAMRAIFGLFFMYHGLEKLLAFETLSTVFPDPLGFGSTVSLSLAIFGELVCSMGFLVGLLYRLALIPMIFTMCIAIFVIHGQDNFAAKELPIIYLSVFVLLYIAGPGKYSVDYWIGNAIRRKM